MKITKSEVPHQKPLMQPIQAVLRSAGEHPDLATGLLVAKFGLTPSQEQDLLFAGHGVFTTTVTRESARASVALLAALGLVLALDDAGTDRSTELFDVSIRITDRDSIKDLQRALKRLGFARKVEADDFFGLAGLEIFGLSQGRAEHYARALQKLDGVTVDLCHQATALFNVLTPSGLTESHMAEILDCVWRMGRSKTRGLMIATGLDRDQLAALLTRFPLSGLTCVNQAFARLNFIALGLGDLSIEGYAKFVERHGAAAGKALSKGHPQRIVTNLPTRAAALVNEEWISMGLEFRVEMFLG